MSLWDDYDAEMQFYRDFPYDVPSDYWRTKDGTEIKLSDMSESHIRNCMRMVGEDDAWYNKFEEELNKRASKDVEIDDDFDYYTAMESLYPDTEYIINKSAYDCGVDGVKEEIVRCKDCEYYRESQWIIATDVPSVCTFFSDGVKVEPNGFCAWGKRRKK